MRMINIALDRFMIATWSVVRDSIIIEFEKERIHKGFLLTSDGTYCTKHLKYIKGNIQSRNEMSAIIPVR